MIFIYSALITNIPTINHRLNRNTYMVIALIEYKQVIWHGNMYIVQNALDI